MTLSVGELLGLGAPDPVLDLPALRYLLVALGVVWAWCHSRAPRGSLVFGLLLYGAALGFWTLAMARPYGAFVDASATARLAQTAVVAASGDPAQSYLAGDPSPGVFWRLVAHGLLPDHAVLLWPTLLPMLLLPLVAVAIQILATDRDLGPLAATLWLLFATGDLDALAGVGLFSGAWQHPEGLAAVLLVVTMVLGAVRLSQRPALLAVVTLVSLLGVLGLPSPTDSLSRAALFRLLTLDQLPWLFLAVLGFRVKRDPAALALIVLGAVLLVATPFGVGADSWVAHALYRSGLILAATAPVAAFATGPGKRLLTRLSAWRPSWSTGRRPLDLGTAALILVLAPGSFAVWWDARRLDPVFEASLQPISANVLEAMAWIRSHTPRHAVFLTGETYAPEVAVLAGRRVLRAPTLSGPPDDQRRFRTERLLLAGKDTTGLAARHGLTHVLVAPGDYPDQPPGWEDALVARGLFHRLEGTPAGWQVYAIEPGS